MSTISLTSRFDDVAQSNLANTVLLFKEDN